MGQSLVTIIVPVYNIEKYLKTCIESIINQTYTQIEIILVNDGSTDSSLEICKQYIYDNRVTIIDKKNEGLSSARQAGIDKANGEYICMVDSDDYIEKDFVEKMYSKIHNDDSDICACASRFFSDKFSRVFGYSESYSKIKITKHDIETKYFELLGRYYMSDSWNKIYKTSFIRNSNVRFSLERKYNGTDLSFNHRLLLHLPQISVVNEPLYNHQILENSRVRRKNKELQKGFMIIMTQIINEVEKLNYTDLINNQLSCLYVKFLREASQDIFNSGLPSKELNSKYKEFYNLNKQYLMENQILDLVPTNMNTISLRIFCRFLNTKNSIWLLKYLSIRQKVLKLHNTFNGIKKILRF
ncbi:glycosyltransferase family 2 protein [Heyndrickxia sp. NPDC080065]|uniref:glycosyltransferase family 2 protein n=1 Tax=Heyndrickxia sp. NPDC080065 TaxID=3390568 RepID=UPI003CFC4563